MKAVRLLGEKSINNRSKAAYKKWVVKDIDNVGTVMTLWEPFKDKLQENDIFCLDHFKVILYLYNFFSHKITMTIILKFNIIYQNNKSYY